MTFSCRTAPWPGRLFSTSAQPISNRRYAKKIRGPGPSSLGIYEPQRGSVPKPNVVPRLRDYVGLARQHEGNGVAPTFTLASIIIGHLVSPT